MIPGCPSGLELQLVQMHGPGFLGLPGLHGCPQHPGRPGGPAGGPGDPIGGGRNGRRPHSFSQFPTSPLSICALSFSI